jgi:hypothetical protein
MRGSFVGARLEEVPDWALGPDGAALQTALGDDQDGAISGLEDAAKMSSPFLCPDDALDIVGATFLLPRCPGEVNGTAPVGAAAGAGYRGRLCGAWAAWQWAGTPTAVLSQLTTYAPGANIVLLTDSNGAWTLPPGAAMAVQSFAGAQVTTYANAWYSRFDIGLGVAFGPLAVQRSIVAPLVVTTTAGFTQPASGGTVTVTVTGSPWSGGEVIYIGTAGYYEVANGSGPYLLKNLGSAAAAEPLLGMVTGTLGAGLNAATTTVIPSGQLVVSAGGTVGDGPNVSSALVIGQGLIGISLAVPAQRETLKAIVLKWKAPHGYFGRIALLWDNTTYPPGEWSFHTDYCYVGRMIGLDVTIGQTPIGGYNRS